MGSDWLLLKDIVRIKGGKRLPKGFVLQDEKNIHPYIRVRDMGSRYVPREGLKYVPDEVFPEIKNYIVGKNDVIISIVGTVGLVSVIDEFFHLASQTENCAKLSGLDKQDAIYLYYCLVSPQGQQKIATRTVGAVQLKLPLYGIENISIPWPGKTKRQHIAHILGSLDDRIELNRRMNETLEAMAQALFKSWFVDFDPVIDNALASGKEIPAELSERAAVRAALGDKRQPLPAEIRTLFPDEFTDSAELGWIPKGWKVGVVGDILERLSVKKRYKKMDVADYGVTPVYEQGASLLLGYHDGEAEIEATLESPAFIFGDHTCVTKLSCESFSISENVIPLKGKQFPTYWVYYAIQGKQSFEEYRRHWMELIVKPVIFPSVELGEAFSVSVKDWSLKKTTLSHQQPILTRIRDTLLPKLLSGEVRIPDAEKMVEELAL